MVSQEVNLEVVLEEVTLVMEVDSAEVVMVVATEVLEEEDMEPLDGEVIRDLLEGCF